MAEPETKARELVRDRAGAEALVARVTRVMAALEAVLIAETGHLGAGRLREGLAREIEKKDLAGQYLQALEACKHNAVALARFCPEGVRTLKNGHDLFRSIVEANQATIATARAVSESLMKGVAEEVRRQAAPSGYAPARAIPVRQKVAPADPMVFSGRF